MSDSEVKKLVVARGYVKGAITRQETYISNVDEVRETQTHNLIARRDTLLKNFAQYVEYNVNISMSDSYKDEENYAEVESKYYKILGVMDDVLSQRREARECYATPAPPMPPPTCPTSKVKLPTITIETFTGKYSEYNSFIEMFTSVIGSDQSLDPIQKLHYLRSYVKGEPYDLIKNLPLHLGSYNEALKLLKNRYYNKNRIVTEHVNNILDLSIMTKSTPYCIRTFVSVVKQNLCALKNLEKRIEFWDPILISILTRKLDQYTARAYQLDRDQDEEPSVSELLSFLEKRALAMENSDNSLRKDWKMEKAAVHVATVDNRACQYCDTSSNDTTNPDNDESTTEQE